MTYKGMMLSDVPNFAFTLGYTNASWTLKADLTCEYVCRLLNHMDEHGYRQCVPARARRPAPATSRSSTSPPATSCAPSTSFPKQGPQEPWKLRMNYAIDLRALRHGPLDRRAPWSSPARLRSPPAEPSRSPDPGLPRR